MIRADSPAEDATEGNTGNHERRIHQTVEYTRMNQQEGHKEDKVQQKTNERLRGQTGTVTFQLASDLSP